MKALRLRAPLLVALTAASLFLVGCSAGETDGTAPSAETAPPSATPTVEPAPDLSGEWKQTNSQAADSYQTATISGSAMTVDWVSDNGDTRSLYWAGTFEAPTTSGPFTWDSVNDTAQTDAAMLASGSPTKAFTYDDGEISYEVTALGTTVTVRLGR